MHQYLHILSLLFCTYSLSAQTIFYGIQQKNIQPNSFDLSWSTSASGTAIIRYGKTTAFELGSVTANQTGTQHQVTIPNLDDATFYYAQAGLMMNGTAYYSADTRLYTTQSLSSGSIKVLFNKSTDNSYAVNGNQPFVQGSGYTVENEIVNMINTAQNTIDIAVYNCTRYNIPNALKAAHNRGVRVRYIANASSVTSNSALTNMPFNIFYANPNALMHNKFIVIDANSSSNSKVWMGSQNLTYNNIVDAANNSLIIEDQALAKAYTIEFEEMWGSTTAYYSSSNSKVGAAKTDNTPHVFNIGGITVESYFSPSDRVASKIENAVRSADHDFLFALFSFTYNDLGTAIKDLHTSGIEEHGIMENINDIGSEYNFLTGRGVDLLADELHHKYAIVDAGDPQSDPMVITGSHNWTSAANTANDENTLIVHDATIANLYAQEFAARWCEAKNNSNCALPNIKPANTAIEQLSFSEMDIRLFPNPADKYLILECEQNTMNARIEVFTTLGQRVLNEEWSNGKRIELNIENLAKAAYLVRITQDNRQSSQLFIK